MWSYSSCAKLHQKYNVLTVFFIGIKELCTAFCGQCLTYSESRRNFNRLRLDASLLPSIPRGIQEISRTVVCHVEQIGQECTDATSTRLPSCSHNQKPPPPRIRRRTCRTHSFTTISEMAPFFLK